MPETPRGDTPADRPSVLIVEPDANIAHLFVLALGEEGYAVESAGTPDAALAMLAARGPDAFAVVLSAACAPLRTPYAWLDRLRARTRAPIVICTRYPAACYADHRARGYAAVVEEPCDPGDVVHLVGQLCAHNTP